MFEFVFAASLLTRKLQKCIQGNQSNKSTKITFLELLLLLFLKKNLLFFINSFSDFEKKNKFFKNLILSKSLIIGAVFIDSMP